jgi:hypothetical protein
LALTLALCVGPLVQAADKTAQVSPDDLRTYLTYLSSDELEGRETFHEGLGLAQGYIAEQLRALGVKPGGDHGGYFERVSVVDVKAAVHSSLTVEVNGQSKTFKDGEGVTFPKNAGGKRTVVIDQVEFLGYGLNAPSIHHNDYVGKDVKGKAVVFLGAQGPKDPNAPPPPPAGSPEVGRGGRGGFGPLGRLLRGRTTTAIEDEKALATIGVGGGGGRGGAPATAAPAGAGGGFGNRLPLETSDFTTVQRLDNPTPPSVTAQDALFEFLFSDANVKYADLKAKAEKQEDLPTFALKGVKLTFNIDNDYKVVRTQYTRNVVGIVEGTDPKLKDTWVTMGAHLDHVGYAEGEIVQGQNGPQRTGRIPGGVKKGALEDRIWNGADDDGSGSATLLGIAKAFATGPKPKRSVAFFWHTGEEEGLYGSKYNADYPAIPNEKVVANLNMDMIGRNDKDKIENANQVLLVGSDRISTELHEIVIDVNKKLAHPMTLDFAMNDPADPERVYYRSDHYSYASKGIPIIFFTTGLHEDYHVNTDSVEKIDFQKMARIGQLVYATGMHVANMDHAPVRDNKGPRAGAAAVTGGGTK